MKKITTKKIITYGIFAAIILAAALFFFLMPGQDKVNREGNLENLKIPVKTVEASVGMIQEYIRLNGDVQASSTVVVVPDTSGKLTEIRVKAGQFVRKGEVLALVNPSRPGANFALSPVVSPVSGAVTEVLGNVGSTITPAIPVVRIGQLSDLEVVAHVSERYVSRLAMGQEALISVIALPGVVTKAYVSEIAPVVNPRTRTMEISFSLNGSSELFKAGMLADISLIVEEKKSVIRIPESSIILRGDDSIVFVLAANGKAEERKIKPGLIIDGYAEVIEGIYPGEKVIFSGKALITDGAEVDLIEELPGLPLQGNLRS